MRLVPRRRPAMVAAMIALGLAAPAHADDLLAKYHLAEYESPFHCQPPMGQAMFEMGARNMAMRHRQAPTPANKAAMCNSYRKVVEAYAKADHYCRGSNCTTDAFRETCARRRQKLQEWQERRRAECGGRR